MDLIINTLKSVAKVMVEPMCLITLIIISVIFYIKNTKVAKMQKLTLGENLDSPLVLTLSQIVLGVIAGCIGSLILNIVGVTFYENSGIEFIFLISLILYFYKPKLACFSYSGAILGFFSLLFLFLNTKFGVQRFIIIDITSIIIFVGIFHIIESILVFFDGSKGAIHVFTSKDDKILGGFTLDRGWIVPIAVLIIFKSSESQLISSSILAPNWWPIINKSQIIQILPIITIMLLPFYSIIGYSNTTFKTTKKERIKESASSIFLYGIILILISILLIFGILNEFVGLALMPLVHEIMIRIPDFMDKKRKNIYVSDEDGISVLDVVPNKLMYRLGIRSGDKIVSVNGKKLKSDIEFFEYMNNSRSSIEVEVKKLRGPIKEYRFNFDKSNIGVLLVPISIRKDNNYSKYDNIEKDGIDKNSLYYGLKKRLNRFKLILKNK